MGGEGEGVQRATAKPSGTRGKDQYNRKMQPHPRAQSFARGILFFPPNDKKTPLTLTNQGLIGIRQRLILPGRVQPSTFSTGELNFCVRDGNRWNLSVIATGNCGYLVASTFSFLPFRKRRVEDPRTLTTAHRMILQTVPISSQFSVSDLLSLACVCCLLRFLFLRFLLCFAAFPLSHPHFQLSSVK